MSSQLFRSGTTAVIRGILNGRTRYEHATRVVDSGTSWVISARWPGTATRHSPYYIESLRTGNRELRTAVHETLAQGNWTLADSTWQRTGVVEQTEAGRWFSVSRMFGPDGALVCWYVNFERPPTWRPDGWDTNDLAIDLVVLPDGTWRWKDEDEYAHERKLGLITDAEHAAVQQARDQAVSQIEARTGPFAENATGHWIPDPTWPVPSFPAADTTSVGSGS